MTRGPLRVAAAQAAAEPGEVERNARAAAELVSRASGVGARLVALPELFLPGYHPPTLAGDPAGCDLEADDEGWVSDPRLDPLVQSATEAVVVVSASVRRAGRRSLSALVVDAAGVRVAYDKQHLWGGEELSLFSPGERGASVTVDGWVVGLGICYDGCFPEHARAAALDGADVYVCPSAYLLGSQPRRDLYYAARALDNTMYVVLANAVGGPAPWTFCGGSAVHGPLGEALARGSGHESDVVVAELDPQQLARARAEHPMLAEVAQERRRSASNSTV
ncbi:MAG TPA: carbon-nitrogen hydrolase family protein [Actinomycetales bacterium]|nr:carbon-nitrogen hydrolase family protein [Actinomycetales bacterium]